MQYHQIFPTTIATDHYPDEVSRNLHFLERRMGTSHYVSEDTNVLDIDFMSDVKQFIIKRLNQYYRNVLKEKNVEPYITQSWVNFTEKNQFTHPHRHVNSIVSGVFYVSADDEVTLISDSESSFNNRDSRYKLSVKDNDLILFPSSLLHYVPPHPISKMRISIAFNSFAVGTFGNHDILTGLNVANG
jgi:hypothetical protein